MAWGSFPASSESAEGVGMGGGGIPSAMCVWGGPSSGPRMRERETRPVCFLKCGCVFVGVSDLYFIKSEKRKEKKGLWRAAAAHTHPGRQPIGQTHPAASSPAGPGPSRGTPHPFLFGPPPPLAALAPTTTRAGGASRSASGWISRFPSPRRRRRRGRGCWLRLGGGWRRWQRGLGPVVVVVVVGDTQALVGVSCLIITASLPLKF